MKTVFAEGGAHAKLMIVGEQPGLQVDIAGEPFIGPAGKMLRKVMDEIKLSAKEIYITNAVKHFKNEVIKERQIHRTPNLFEINACKPLLKAEIALVKPKVILCLGVTAAKALIGPGFNMTRQHGKWEAFSTSQKISGTYHPAAILRAPTPELKTSLFKSFQHDIARAADLAYPS
jgi:uracil-DNA glycosylase